MNVDITFGKGDGKYVITYTIEPDSFLVRNILENVKKDDVMSVISFIDVVNMMIQNDGNIEEGSV